MRRPLLIGLVAGGLAVVILVVVGIVVAVTLVDRSDAVTEHGAASAELSEVVVAAEAAIAEADEVLAIAADPLVPPEPAAAVTAERDAVADTLDGVAPLLAVDPATLGTEEIRELTDGLETASIDLRDDASLVRAALVDLVAATRESSAAVETANFSADNAPHLEFRAAVGDLDGASGDATGDDLIAYLDAAHALEASHAEEIAEKAGPLLDSRLAVEAFARSIAGGVLLEFDWAVTVNGYGTGGSYGGTSYWWSDQGGYATITLSDSVAAMWPGAGVQSLVVHEVGHAILSRCTDLFFGSEYEAGGEEPWATAWAIGMGYTSDGNGESIYGRPADGLIQLSTQCR